MIDAQSLKQFSFAGHDTFHLRYAWLPKAAEYIQKNKGASLNKYDEIMANLGIGKNMATSLRHWAESSQLFNRLVSNGAIFHELSEVGKVVFDEDGDPFFQTQESLWLIHYLITSNHKKNGLWFYLFNIFNETVIIKEEFLFSAISWFKNQGIQVNEKSIEKDFLCCMNMYNSSKLGTKKNEDLALSSPLRELGLIKKVGNEFRFKQMNRPEIPDSVISFCLMDYLEKNDFQKFTPFSELLNGIKSPGRVFRLTEDVLQSYLRGFTKNTSGYEFDSTAGMQQLIKKSDNKLNKNIMLKRIYE